MSCWDSAPGVRHELVFLPLSYNPPPPPTLSTIQVDSSPAPLPEERSTSPLLGVEGDEATVQVTTHSVAAQTRLKQFVFHRVSLTLNSPRYEVIITTTLRNLGKTLDLLTFLQDYTLSDKNRLTSSSCRGLT